jgi:sugar O-acyltransferase (sialic acid O-acetyltransferase NeuD family)
VNKDKKLVIIGDGATAEIIYEYFTYDSRYEVCAFAVESRFRNRDLFKGLPVIDYETIENTYSAEFYEVFVAITFAKLNRVRMRLVYDAKNKGYCLASYISSRAFVWKNVEFGEHCFIFENNTIQPYVSIGNNVILWSGNHIGHHSRIGNNCFISSQVVISGFCEIGDNTFIGVNSSIADGVCIASDNWIGPGLTIAKDTVENMLYGPVHADVSKVPARRFFRL